MSAEEQLRMARLALVDCGYFSPEQVADGEIAPRIHELFKALAERRADCEDLAAAVERWRKATEAAQASPYDFCMSNARRLLQAAEQETDRGLMERYEKLADSYIGMAALALQRERGDA